MVKISRSGLGALAVFSAAFGGMAFQLAPTPQARLSVLALVPFVAWLSLPDPASTGGCPVCSAQRRRQIVTVGMTTVEPGTRAGSRDGSVKVSLGWDVTTDVQITCSKCGGSRHDGKSVFVERSYASNAAEAAVLARSQI